jgi:hypothetical protein
MKKNLFISIALFTLFMVFVVAPYAFAQLPQTQDKLLNPFQNDPTVPASPIESVDDGKELALSVIRWFYTIIFIAAVVVILMAALNFIRGGSDEKKLTTAKAQLKWAAVGIAVGLLATGVSAVIREFLVTGAAGSPPPVPEVPIDNLQGDDVILPDE